MTVAVRRSRQPKLLAAGALEGEISSFRLQLAAEGKSPKTIGMYTEAVQWFAAAHLLRESGRTCWEQVCGQDVQRWMVWLLSYDPGDPLCSDVDLWNREITVRGKGGQARSVKIGHETACSIDRYLRVRARHAQAYRGQLWLGVNNRGR